MIGRNHIIVNTAALAPVGLYAYKHTELLDTLPENIYIRSGISLSLLYVYIKASKAPDLDLKPWRPFSHRTYLHSIWPLVPLAYLIYINYNIYLSIYLGVFALGYFLHLFFDSFSNMGIDFIYPIIGYKGYGYSKVLRIPHLGLYRTGEMSEYIFSLVWVLIFLVLGYYIYLM